MPYTATSMKRYGIWLISALIAVPIYFLTSASGMSGILVLLLTFIGALAGSVLGTYVMQRR